MVRVPMAAKASCEEPGCSAETPVNLFLTATGGFVFSFPPNAGKWQVGAMGPGAPFNTLCPKHHRMVQAAAEMPPEKPGPGLVFPR